MALAFFTMVCLLIIVWTLKVRNGANKTQKKVQPSETPTRVDFDLKASSPSLGGEFQFKSRGGYVGPYVESTRKRSDFSYIDNPNPSEFLVYFIESEELDAYKIGVGTSGRVLQLLNSSLKTEEGIRNIGWKVLRTAKFSDSSLNYEAGRYLAYEAEAKAHFYWRKYLNEPSSVSENDMGYSQLIRDGETRWYLTKGFSETVQRGSVCEKTSWDIVTNSKGYLGPGSTFYDGRELVERDDKKMPKSFLIQYEKSRRDLSIQREKRLQKDNEDTRNYSDQSEIPTNHSFRVYKKMPANTGSQEGNFWARVRKQEDGHWMWEGSVMTDGDYGVMLWEGSPRPAHRIAWQIVNGGMPQGQLLNTCKTKFCVNPLHWNILVTQKFDCLTEGCPNRSRTTTKPGFCESCRARNRREHLNQE